MKLGLISLGGPSSKDILKKCKEHFSKTKSIDIREIEVHITSNGLHITYQGKPLEHFDCLYVRGSYKYVSLKKSITLAKNHTAYMPLKPLSFVGHDKFLTALELQKSKIPIPILARAILTTRFIYMMKTAICLASRPANRLFGRANQSILFWAELI